MKYGVHRFFSVISISGIISLSSAQPSSETHPEDSLTMALCVNQEQIVSKRSGDFRIAYFMGETELNMKTMRGFLSLNGASSPFFRQFRTHRFIGIGMMVAGIGLIVADGYITKPAFPIISIGGIATSIWGIGVFIGANEKFRLAIYAYNRDICKIK